MVKTSAEFTAEIERRTKLNYHHTQIVPLHFLRQLALSIERGENPSYTYIAKCSKKGCKHAVQRVLPREIDGFTEKKHYLEPVRCPEHNTVMYFVRVNYVHKEGHKCDARCMNARGHNCECSCGGVNHGKNFA